LTVSLYRQILQRIERLAHTAADGTCAATMTSVNLAREFQGFVPPAGYR
jgi:hypothetical protein